MRHSVFGRRLGRDTNARSALLGNLASSLIEQGHITTTVTKAKFVQGHLDKLITKTKKNSIQARRVVAQKLTDRAFKKLITEIAPAFTKRAGGYTRIIKLTSRRGDAAPMAKIEFVELEKIEKPKISKNTEKVAQVDSIDQRKSANRSA